jgi:hypothetical protein
LSFPAAWADRAKARRNISPKIVISNLLIFLAILSQHP